MNNCLIHLFLTLLPLTLFCFLISGCAADNPQNMIPEIVPAMPVPASVNIKVSGAKGSNPNALTNLTDEEITTAIVSSLNKAHSFLEFRQGGASDYQMEIVLTIIEPGAGFTDTVTIHASWMLIQQSNDTVVWKQAIDSSCTKTVGDAFAGGTREIMAEEGAVKENIRIAMLSLQKAPMMQK